MDEVFAYEKEHGSSIGNFKSLVNISKEFSYFNYDANSILDIWKQYRINNHIQDLYRDDPYLFHGFKEVIGEEHIRSCFAQGGVFATYHFGDYRYVPFQIYESTNMNKENSIDIVVDTESYESERSLTKWNELREKNNVNYIISENHSSGLKLLKILRKSGSILLYLDGNSGLGNDSYEIFVRHLSSTVQIRSGIFRLVALLQKPICIIVADQSKQGRSRIIAYEPFFVNKNQLELAVEKAYSFFRNALKKNPHLWRFWFRHHRYVKEWGTPTLHCEKSINIDWYSEDKKFGIDLRTGTIYQMKK